MQQKGPGCSKDLRKRVLKYSCTSGCSLGGTVHRQQTMSRLSMRKAKTIYRTIFLKQCKTKLTMILINQTVHSRIRDANNNNDNNNNNNE